MPMHFGRFRILNGTKAPDERKVTKATFQMLPLPLIYTVVGPGTLFPELPSEVYAEEQYEEGEIDGMELVVNLELEDGTKVENWTLSVPMPPTPPGTELRGVDVLVHKPGADYKASAYVAGWNFAFEVGAENFSP